MTKYKAFHLKIVPEGHNNCQLSIVNCQFGEAAKQQFVTLLMDPHSYENSLSRLPIVKFTEICYSIPESNGVPIRTGMSGIGNAVFLSEA